MASITIVLRLPVLLAVLIAASASLTGCSKKSTEPVPVSNAAVQAAPTLAAPAAPPVAPQETAAQTIMHSDGKAHKFKLKGVTLGASIDGFRKDNGFNCTPPGFSKAVSVCAPLLTNNNWKQFGDLRVLFALLLFSSDGRLIDITLAHATGINYKPEGWPPEKKYLFYDLVAEAAEEKYGAPTNTEDSMVWQSSSDYAKPAKALSKTSTWVENDESFIVVDKEDVVDMKLYRELACKEGGTFDRFTGDIIECNRALNAGQLHIRNVATYEAAMTALANEEAQKQANRSQGDM
ncbi:MAG: hypothetical protein KKD65_12780 [Gammaproteobacteria bacterium]|nr:hypothetical protein [Gammaproteobacteria bacterium]